MLKIPDKYLGKYPIPPEIVQTWNRWEGVRWRVMRYMDKNNCTYPPDQRFTVSPPRMCRYHYEQWYAWRDRRFNGNRWPGHPGSPFVIRPDYEMRRWEWDEKTIEQMQMTEQFCAAGRGCSK